MRRAKKRREKREKDDLIGSDQSGDQSEAESVDNFIVDGDGNPIKRHMRNKGMDILFSSNRTCLR